MGIAGQFLFDWLQSGFGMSSEAALTFNRVYWCVRMILLEGSILLFLIVLHSKQKD